MTDPFLTQATGTPRRDGLPENTRYRDDGCNLSPSCLRCPLPQCKYDPPPIDRGEVVRTMRKAGHTIPAIGLSLGVSSRTVFRILNAPATMSDDSVGDPWANRAKDDTQPSMTLGELAQRSQYRVRAPWPKIHSARRS